MENIFLEIGSIIQEAHKSHSDIISVSSRIVEKLLMSKGKPCSLVLAKIFEAWDIRDIELPMISGDNSEKKNKAIALMSGKVYVELMDLYKQNLTKDDFYDSLWEIFFAKESDTHAEYEKAATLLLIWQNSCIPYFQTSEGMRMDNAEYRDRRKQNRKIIQNLKFLVRTPYFHQKTERASSIVKLISEIADERDKVVCAAALLDEARISD